MIKSNRTYVAAETFTTVLTALKANTLEQSGFIRVQGPAGRQMYVAKTKRVGRVDLSGFRVVNEELNVVVTDVEPFGAVSQQLSFEDRSGDEIVADFVMLYRHMMTLSPIEPKVKAAKVKAEKAKAFELTLDQIALLVAAAEDIG